MELGLGIGLDKGTENTTIFVPSDTNHLLKESGLDLVLEDGTFILLE